MTLPLLRSLLFPLLLVGGLLAPGWLLGRALRTPGGIVGAFLGSAALLLNLVLVMDALGIRLDAPNLSIGVALLNGVLLVASMIRRSAAPSAEASAAFLTNASASETSSVTSAATRHYTWLLVPAALGFAAIAIRAGFDPLSGFDAPFRWDFLAQQMFHEGNLRFYPPMSAEDFLHYGWCDGIAPLVSTLYLWAYFCLGRIEAWATTPVVLAQAALVFWLVWRLAARRAGPAAGAAACALLATSAALLWGIAMGQETGLTALSMVAMFWFFEKAREQPAARWLAWAGLAAGTGALAREYGLALIPLGLLALAWWRIPRRGWWEFAVAATVVALPWYLRNWIKTGHPLYCHSLGGLFPTNPISLEYFRVVTAANGILQHPSVTLPALGQLLALLAAVPLVIGLAVGVARWRTHGPWLAAALAFTGLWLWSISQTSGGYPYSTRVLTPVIALTAVLGGIGLAHFATSRRGWLLALVLAVVAADAAERSLFLPVDTQPPWWRIRFFAWRDFGDLAARWRANPNWAAIADAAEGRQILVSDPLIHAILARAGAKPVPFFSPAVHFLFESNPDFETSRARLRTAGFRFILMTRNNEFQSALLAPHPFFGTLERTPPVSTTPLYFVYDLYPPNR